MNQTFQAAQERAKIPGSAVLNAWRMEHGPESRRISNQNDIRPSLTVEEISNLLISSSASYAGPAVTEATALRVSAVYACVALIAGAISTLPLPVYERTATSRARVDHPYFWLLNEQPDPDYSAAVFWEYMVSSRLFYGDCFAEIVRPSFRSNRVTGFKAHHPMRVNPFRDAAGDVFYRITPIVGAQYVLSPADVIHVPSLGFDGLTSPSPITYAAKQAIGTSLATGEHNARFFSNGARPDFALKTKASMSEEQAKMLRNTWGSRHQGTANSHLPAILTGGLEVEKLSFSSADSQILETAGWNLEEICRILGVPPFMVGSTEKTTSWGSGVANMGQGFVKFTLLRDLVKFSQEFNRKLWPIREKFFVEFDVSGIERGDLKSENEALRIALGRAGEPGWMTQNEVRRLKLLPPISGGDEVTKGVPEVKPAPTQLESQQATAKNLADMRLIANDAQKPTIVNVAAPIINLTVPEQTAPIVQNVVNLPGTVVNVEAVMPEQSAPVVNNTVNVEKPDAAVVNIAPQVVNVAGPVVNVAPAEVSVILPTRQTDTTIIRDSNGQIVKATQIERDA